MNRDHLLQEIKGRREPFDLVVVGGGATGLGTAVDAAARGHSVCLVEQADFAKGTSSRSTKLVHGGVRYLQQGNLSLVLEALRERGRLALNAPHLVHDLAFVIPNYSWWEGPFYGIGMKVYDQMAGRLGLGPSRWLSREETIELIPTVEQENLRGGVMYHDGQFDDSRLAVNLAQTAVGLGACVANYLRCTGLLKARGPNPYVEGLLARDEESGDEFEIRGKCVINATGVFADSVRRMDEPAAPAIIQASQGVHLVLPRRFLPGNSAIMIPKTSDGRVLFAVPWHGCVVVGTTDTPIETKSLEPRALEEEINFIMTEAARYLEPVPQREDVRSVFAGLRPLIRHDNAENTAALSRDHHVFVSQSGLVTVTGGKWTTYRKMAEDTVDHTEMVAGLEARPCPTAGLQIHGWTREPIPEPNLEAYGADADAIRALGEAEKVHPQLALTRAEVRWHAREEMARSVEDCLARRSRSLLLDARAAAEASPAVAKVLAEELGKTAAWEQAQVRAFRDLAQGYLLPPPAPHPS